MTKAVQQLFSEITTKLEDLHSIAVEGQQSDYAPDMHGVLTTHLRSGLHALHADIGAILAALASTHS